MTFTAPCPPPPRPATPHAGTDRGMRPDAIGPQDALIVLQHFGHTTPGVPDMTGTFRGRLVALIAEADAHDQRHLANAHPALVAAVRLAVSSPTGIATLHAIASTR